MNSAKLPGTVGFSIIVAGAIATTVLFSFGNEVFGLCPLIERLGSVTRGPALVL
jgi:hypothetical protein